jgi:hypothetical protein
MAAHRYWRINITAVNAGSRTRIVEVEMRLTAGGADQCTGGTASASNTTIGFSAAEAFDDIGGTLDNGWDRAAAASWLKYDFGAGNDKDITEVAITPSVYPTYTPKNFSIEWSDDNAAWTALVTLTNITAWTSHGRKVFDSTGEIADSSIAAACRYWALVVEAVDVALGDGDTGVSELQMLVTHTGADQITSAMCVAGQNPSVTTPVADIADNNSSTDWGMVIGAAPRPNWMYVDFGSGVTKTIAEISLTAPAEGNSPPKDFRLMRSDDSIRWTSEFAITGITGWSAGQKRHFDSTGEITAWAGSGVRPVVMCVC